MHDFIKQLLNGQSVEWKTLGEVCDFKNGFAFKSDLFKENGFPIIRITNINGKEVDLFDVKYFHASDYETNLTSYEIYKGDILIAMSGATTGKIGCYEKDEVAYLNQRVGKFLVKEQVLNHRYLYHFLLSQTTVLYMMAGGGAQPNLSSTNLMQKLIIPIPPLSVQQKIAQILDALTALTAELTAELTLRLKQYQCYRDKLLSENELNKVGFEWKALGEIAEYSKSRVSFDKLNENNYIGVDNLLQNRQGKTSSTHIPDKGKVTAYVKNDILIGNIRPYLKKVWYADNNGGASGDVLVIHLIDNHVNPRYLYQVLSDDKFFDYNMQYARGAKMPRGDKEAILRYQIPIPPISEQIRIVNILDKFETLTHSMTEGLPKEIELRQKQYEYYREVLLGFN